VRKKPSFRGQQKTTRSTTQDRLQKQREGREQIEPRLVVPKPMVLAILQANHDAMKRVIKA
jgi:hypothetical protein